MRTATKISALALSFFFISFAQAAPTSLLKNLGLKEGQSYALARTQLIRKGWHVDANYALARDEMPPYRLKEVICGNGSNAVCSARFLRKDQEITLTLRPKKILLLEGAWGDK